MQLRFAAFIVLGLALITVGPPAAAQTPSAPSDPALLVPIDAFVSAVVAHEPEKFATSFAPGATILDDVPPNSFAGPDAPREWYAAFGRTLAQAHMTVTYLGHGSPHYEHVAGDHAYVVVPADFSYAMAGKPYAESAAWTFGLVKTSGGWKIASWAWSLLTSTGE